MLASLIAYALLFGGSFVAAQSTPWVLGDENVFQCYTLSTNQDIPTPRGLSVRWDTAPFSNLTSASIQPITWRVTVDDSVFWSDATNIALLGTALPFYRSVCNPSVPVPACAETSSSECCIYHANIHSCRQAESNCPPWVGPRNATATASSSSSTSSSSGSSSSNVLVTHTAAQVGNVGPYTADLHLPEGEWFIVGHFKIMTFQCAVGSSRVVLPPPAPAASSSGLGAGAIVGIVVGALAVAVIVGVGAAFARGSDEDKVRDTSCAPKEGQVTTIFTDIQDSTKLWSEATASMAVALDKHHDIIRRAIIRHKAYEVKTAGDSFMIVAGTVEAGVNLCLDIQKELQTTAFPISIQQLYDGHELVDDDASDEQCFADEPFNGLRVRMGVHTGYPSIVFDDVAKGYDYYGPAINISARVESKALGGQILLSTDALSALRESDTADAAAILAECNVTTRGQFALKGVAEPVELFDLIANALPNARAGRLTYAMAEARKHENENPDEDLSDSQRMSVPDDNVSMHSNASRVGGVNGDGIDERLFGPTHPFVKDGRCNVAQLRQAATLRREQMETMLKPFKGPKTAKVRLMIIEELCNGWRVKFRPKRVDTSYNELISRIIQADKTVVFKDAFGASLSLQGRSFGNHSLRRDGSSAAADVSFRTESPVAESLAPHTNEQDN